MSGSGVKLLWIAAASVCAAEFVSPLPLPIQKPGVVSRAEQLVPAVLAPAVSRKRMAEFPRQPLVQTLTDAVQRGDKAHEPEGVAEALGKRDGAAAGEREGAERGLRQGQLTGEQSARQKAEQDARPVTFRRAFERGFARGKPLGEARGYEDGKLAGEHEGARSGYQSGWRQGRRAGSEDGYVTGHETGFSRGRAERVSKQDFDEGYDKGRAEGMDEADRIAQERDFPRGWEEAKKERLQSVELRPFLLDNNARWADEPGSARSERSEQAEKKMPILVASDPETKLFALGLASETAINSAAIGSPRRTLPTAVLPERLLRETLVPDFSVRTVPAPAFTYLRYERTFPAKELNDAYQLAYKRSYADHFAMAFRRVHTRIARDVFTSLYENQYAIVLQEPSPHWEENGFREGFESAYRAHFSAAHAVGFEMAHEKAFATGRKQGRASAYRDAFTRGQRAGYELGKLSAAATAYTEGYEAGRRDGYADHLPTAKARARAAGYHQFFETARREEVVLLKSATLVPAKTDGGPATVGLVLQNLGDRESEAGSLTAQIEGEGYGFVHQVVNLRSLPAVSETHYENVFVVRPSSEDSWDGLSVTVFSRGKPVGSRIVTVAPPSETE